jgi:hypothetical protein
LLTAIVVAAPIASRWTDGPVAHASGARSAATMIRVVPRTGSPYVRALDGIGCSQAICSRVFVRALVADDEGTAVQRIRFDTVAAIEMLGGGDARVRFNDGTSRRVLVAADNRVLYLIDDAGRTKRLDLGNVVSIEFLQRTPWGDPDLQGVWSGVDSMAVPLDRDAALGTRNLLTEEEYQRRRAQLLENASRRGIEATNFGAEPEILRSTSRQGSLVVDPADGRRPARTPMADARSPSRSSFSTGSFASIADMGKLDRCISSGTVPAALPGNGLDIVQAPGFVAIRTEWIHEARVISLDQRPHLGPAIATYAGDARGRWEGRTLVVETTHFNGQSNLYGNAGERPTTQLKVIERYTLTDADVLWYEATIDDPETWTRPWTVAFPRKRDASDRVFEYACHEGNYGVANILHASRAAEASPSK